MLLDLTIDMPPQGKQRARARIVYRGGKPAIVMTTPNATRRFERAIAKHARRVFDGDPVSGVLGIRVDAYFRRPAKPPKGHPCRAGTGVLPFGMGGRYPDSSNVLKAVEDALNGVVYVDDAQISDARCVRWWAEEAQASCVRVRVWRMDVRG